MAQRNGCGVTRSADAAYQRGRLIRRGPSPTAPCRPRVRSGFRVRSRSNRGDAELHLEIGNRIADRRRRPAPQRAAGRVFRSKPQARPKSRRTRPLRLRQRACHLGGRRAEDRPQRRGKPGADQAIQPAARGRARGTYGIGSSIGKILIVKREPSRAARVSYFSTKAIGFWIDSGVAADSGVVARDRTPAARRLIPRHRFRSTDLP